MFSPSKLQLGHGKCCSALGIGGRQIFDYITLQALTLHHQLKRQAFQTLLINVAIHYTHVRTYKNICLLNDK